jgi:hypothetical protein
MIGSAERIPGGVGRHRLASMRWFPTPGPGCPRVLGVGAPVPRGHHSPSSTGPGCDATPRAPGRADVAPRHRRRGTPAPSQGKPRLGVRAVVALICRAGAAGACGSRPTRPRTRGTATAACWPTSACSGPQLNVAQVRRSRSLRLRRQAVPPGGWLPPRPAGRTPRGARRVAPPRRALSHAGVGRGGAVADLARRPP